MTAIGFIEVKGLVNSTEATDAMLKATDVGLVGIDTIGAGLATVIVTGEVGTVKAVMETEAEAASRVGELLVVHVIPRPHADIAKVLSKSGPATE